MTKYRYYEKYNDEDTWGYDISSLLRSHINHTKFEVSWGAHSRGIEEQIDTLSTVIGQLAEALVAKNIFTPDEILKIIGVNSNYSDRVSYKEVEGE